MDKFSFISLWDIYNGLLTRTQQEITDLYFNNDLTVSEIAEQKGVSRQAVSECLKGCKKQIEEYEEKLHFGKRLLDISSEAAKAVKWAEQCAKSHPELSGEVDELIRILGKDFSHKEQ